MGKLSYSEIDQIKVDRARHLAMKSEAPTMPTHPFKEPDKPAPIEAIATRCFAGNYNISDIRFMAMAILQMNDTIGELRERVRRLEAGE
jgi:hypothetical protein